MIDELHSAKAIFIIGLSFTSDLDIRRIVSSEELREKIFFIEIPQLSKSNRKFLDKSPLLVIVIIIGYIKNIA